MRAELQALFAEVEKPTHCSCDEARKHVQPILEMAARAQRQAGEFRQKALTAELTDPTGDDRGALEKLFQTAAAMEKDARDLFTTGRRLLTNMQQFTRYSASEKVRFEKADTTEALAAGGEAPALTMGK